MAETFLQKFSLFIPGKDKKDVAQPAYGTDMRTIEQWGLLVAKYLQSVVEQFITSFHSTPMFSFPGVMVGTVPPSGTQLLAQTFVTSVTVTSGVTAVALSAFSDGYNAVVTGADNAGLVYTLRPGASTLTSLSLAVFTSAGTPYTGADSVSVFVVGA